MLASCSLNCSCRRRWRYAMTNGGRKKPTAPRITGPNENPKRNRPINAPRATATMRRSRYSGPVMLRPARARSSPSVGLPWTLRRRLRFSAAGFSRRSTSSRGVARGSVAWARVVTRSLRTLSSAQKKTKIAAAIGTATIVSSGRSKRLLEEVGECGFDHGQGDALRVADAGALGVRRLVARCIVVVGLERVLERGVGEKPGDDLGLALRHDHGQAGRACAAGRGLGADLDHVELGEDRHRCDLA